MTFRIGKYKDLYIANKDLPTASFKVGGEFKMVMSDANGRFLYETDWFSNLITNVGLTKMYNWNGFTLYTFIGDNNTPPAFTDTQLLGFLAGTQTNAPTSTLNSPNLGAPNYEFYSIRGRRFGAGLGTGTIREVGMGDAGSQNDNDMVIRALVTPEITKSADQVLDVYYRFYVYPDLTDKSGQVTIDGELYDWVQRVCVIDRGENAFTQFRVRTGNSVSLYDGTIGTIIGNPSGNYENSQTFPSNTDQGTYLDATATIGLNNGNVVGATGISAIKIGTDWGSLFSNPGFQTSFNRVSDSAGITKNNTQTLRFDWQMTWDRYTP